MKNTKVSGSMAAQGIITALQIINNLQKEKEKKKKAIGEKRQNDKEAYYRCLNYCQCDKSTCAPLRLKKSKS